MAMKMTEEQIYELAKKRVEEKRGFFSHLAAYVVVNIGLFLIWYFTPHGGVPWFLFPLGGWGIGLVFHFLGVFVFNSMGGQKAIEKEAARIRDQQGRA